MFKGLFGGSKPKKEEPKPVAQPAQQQSPSDQSEMEFEKTILKVQEQEEQFDAKIEKYTNQIDRLREDAKKLTREKKPKAAKFRLNEIQQLEKYIVMAENQKQVFFKVRIQLQNGKSNKMAAETLKKAVDVLKTVQPQDMEEVLDDFAEIQQNADEVAGYFETLAKTDQNEEELDEEMRKLQEEIDIEDSQKLKEKLDTIPNTNINPASLNQPVQVQEKSAVQSNKQDAQFNSALFDQLAM